MFEPATATASLLLFAHKSVIYCLRHDTLKLERKLAKHKTEISLLAVDNVSDEGAGRYAVSYDSRTIAIFWDLFNGAEINRVSSYEAVRVTAWMQDGRCAFGTC